MEKLIKFHTNRTENIRIHTIIAAKIANGDYDSSEVSHYNYLFKCNTHGISSVSYTSWEKAFEEGWE